MGFTISTKSSNFPPPRQLSLLPPPSGTNRFHSVDWWDDCRVSQDSPPYSNKTQKSLTVSTPKTISPQAWGKTRPSAYHKFLKKKKNKTRATNYCSSPYNSPSLAIHKGPIKWRLVQALGSLVKQSFPSTQLFPIPTLYWFIPSKANITLY
jgi:hypothetical protein